MTLSVGTSASKGQSGASQEVTGFTTVASSNALILVAVFGGASGFTTSNFTVSDSASLTWANQILPNSSAQEFDLYYAFAPNGVQDDNITVTNNGGSSSWGFLVLEIDGAATSSVFDPTTAGFDLETSPAPSCTTSNASDMILIFACDPSGGTSTASYTNSYTAAVSTTAWSNICAYAGIAYLVVSSSGNQTSTITFSRSNSSDYAFIIGIKAGSSGTSHTKTLTDSFTPTDSLSKEAIIPLNESLSLLDQLKKKPHPHLAESLSVLDGLAKKPHPHLAESLSVLDGLAKKTLVPLAESLSLVDHLSALRAYFKTLTERASLTDSIRKTTQVALKESLGLVDSIKKKTSIVLGGALSLLDLLQSKLVGGKPFSIGYLEVSEGQNILLASEGSITLGASEGSMTLSVQEI